MDSVLRAAQAHADACSPRESCGLVVQAAGAGPVYVPCRNLALGDEEFLIDPEDWADAEDQGEVLAVVHSHPGQDPPVLSEVDERHQAAMGIPWLVLGARIPARADMVGREFVWGSADCWTLVRDWFREYRDEELPDWPHEARFWEIGKSPFLEHAEEAGFHQVQIQDIAPGDVVLMCVASQVPNHSAVYLGAGQILHHLMGRRSCTESLSPWLRRVAGVYRRNAK